MAGELRWPETFPQRFLADDYSEAAPKGMIEVSRNVIPPIKRQKHIKGPSEISGTLRMTSGQYKRFVEWHRDTLRSGLYNFVGKLTDSVEDETYSFTEEAYSARPVPGGYYDVSFKLLRM